MPDDGPKKAGGRLRQACVGGEDAATSKIFRIVVFSWCDSHGVIAGQNISQWAEDWWTWQLQAPFGTNPLLDASGVDANYNNNGPIFFLGGSLDPNGVVTRDFSIPNDTPILVPVLAYLGSQFTGTGPDPKNIATGTPAAANNLLHEWEKSVDNLFLIIDGVEIGDLSNDLVKTGFFDIGVPQPGSLLDESGVIGDVSHSKSEAYFVVLGGFASGDHTIEFGGSAIDPGTGKHYTNHIVDHVHVGL